jgi:hypothetical protein
MKVRVISRLLVFIVAIGVAATVLGAQSTNVQIRYMILDGTSLTITGSNFGSAPAVSIGDTTLAVSSNSNTEIVAATPPLGKGVHLVKVVRDSSEGGSAVSTLQVE